MNSACRLKSNEGFTLLEVLIAMSVMVFISFAIYQATVETFKLRDILSTEGNFYNSIRLATGILQRDISMIYSPKIATPDPSPSPSGNVPPPPPPQPLPDGLNQTSTFWSVAIDETGLRPSRFVGSDSKMTFIALSNSRVYRDSAESDFLKITYELKPDEKNIGLSGTSMLLKTESPNAFAGEDIKDLTVRSYDLLHGIKKLSYQYYQRDGNTWKITRSWDTEHEETKNKFPDIIEMKLEVIGPQKQSFEGVFKFRPEIPLNGLNSSL